MEKPGLPPSWPDELGACEARLDGARAMFLCASVWQSLVAFGPEWLPPLRAMVPRPPCLRGPATLFCQGRGLQFIPLVAESSDGWWGPQSYEGLTRIGRTHCRGVSQHCHGAPASKLQRHSPTWVGSGGAPSRRLPCQALILH